MNENNVNSNGVDTGVNANAGAGTTPVQAPVEPVGTVNQVQGVETVPDNGGESLEVFDMGQPKTKKKTNTKAILIAVILIALICVIAFGVYYVLSKNVNPKKVFENSINVFYSGIEDAGNNLKNESTIDLLNEPININLTAKLDSSMAELKNFTNVEYGLSMGLDVKNEKVTIGASASENSKKLIEGLMTVLNDRVYLKTNMFDKVIDLGTTEENEISFQELIDALKEMKTDETYEDILYVVKTYKDLLISSLDEEKFSTSNTEITVSGESMKVKKITYNLDKENMERTTNYLRDEMQKDDKFMDILEKYDVTGTEPEDEEDSSATIDEEKNEFEDATISLYVNSVGVVVAGDLYEGEFKNLSFTYLDEKLECYVYNTDGSYLVINYRDSVGDITYYESKDASVPLMIMNFGEDLVKLNLNINENGTQIKVGVDLTNIKDEGKTGSADYKVTLNLVSANMGNIDLSVTGKYSIGTGAVNAFDTNGAVKKEELTEEDVNTIMTNLMPVLEKFGLDSIITGNSLQDPGLNEPMDANAI